MKADQELENLLEEINASVSGEIIKSPPPNPFVGLRPFKSEEDVIFFGRREQTIELLQLLHDAPRFVAVVGSSGSGKSSLIQAGLIPKLKAGSLAGERDKWTIATMRPGESPMYNFVVALLTGCGEEATDENISSLSDAIRAKGVQAIVERFAPLFPHNDVNVLLLVDQFEEIFPFAGYSDSGNRQTDPNELVKRRNEAGNFVALMLESSKQKELPIYVVMAMRSDFLGDCDVFDELPKAINRSQYLVARLTRTQQQEAIENPILLCGETIAPRLLDRLLNDLGEEPIGKEGEWAGDQMPIMQHALMRTWNQWQDRHNGELDLEDYLAAGTITNALDKDADEALKETGQPILTKRIFQLLTNRDEQGRRTRRRARLSEIIKVTGAKREEIMDVIQCFQRNNRSFVTLSPYETKDDFLVDISHESLIRQWITLRNWVDEEAESRKTYLTIADAARGYSAKTKTKGLLRNPELQLMLTWEKSHNPTEPWAKRYDSTFNEAMAYLKKSKRRWRLTLVFYGVLALVGVVLLGMAARYRQNYFIEKAQRETAVAQRETDQVRLEEKINREQLVREQQLQIALIKSEEEKRLNQARFEASETALKVAQQERQNAVQAEKKSKAETVKLQTEVKTRDKAIGEAQAVGVKNIQLQRENDELKKKCSQSP